MNALRRVIKFLGPYKRDAIVSIILQTLAVGVGLLIPRLVQVIIDQGVTPKNIQIILNTSIIMMGVSILSTLLSIGNTIFPVRATQNFIADVRKAVYYKIHSFSFKNLDDYHTGQLLVHLTSDVNQLQYIVLYSLRMLPRSLLIIMGSFTIMVVTNQQLAVIMLLLLPLTFLLTLVFILKAQPLYREIQRKFDNLNQVVQENLTGIRVVKNFVRRDYENKKFAKASSDLMDQSIQVGQLLSILSPLMLVLFNLSTVAFIYFGGLHAIAGTFTVGEIIAFINYLILMISRFLSLAFMAGRLAAANASSERIMRILDSTSPVQDKTDAKILTDVKGRVVFEDVYFKYSEDSAVPVLQNINFVAEPGQKVAILGATGSGKSSLIHLIPRFYDVTKGRVTIDGVDVRDITQNSLRSQIGISLQETVLFSGTVRDNIKYGRDDATEEEVITAAKAAQAHEFTMDFPDGYDTMVGQRGVYLSGGQKQ
ncbi:ABC transporter ATP-binding protein, partial [Candidatus Bathyarchaeota archaeon]|nr:ABC transporter ATP-binding protein [Candidatus Bathyarchaeota archaeon]